MDTYIINTTTHTNFSSPDLYHLLLLYLHTHRENWLTADLAITSADKASGRLRKFWWIEDQSFIIKIISLVSLYIVIALLINLMSGMSLASHAMRARPPVILCACVFGVRIYKKRRARKLIVSHIYTAVALVHTRSALFLFAVFVTYAHAHF